MLPFAPSRDGCVTWRARRSDAPAAAPLGVERCGSPRAQAARVRRSRNRRRPRHPARRRSHARSAAAAAVSRARDRRAASRRSVPRSAAPRCCARGRDVARCRSTATRCRAATGSTTSHRGRARRSAARLPARRREGRRRPLRDLSRGRGRRSADARDLRGDPARRGVSHELHLHAARRVSRRSTYRRQRVARARQRGCGSATCAWPRRSPACSAPSMLTVQYFVLLPPFAWLARRAERREPLGLDADLHTTAGDRRRASTDMKILGISAHYHDSAAALVVDGVPVCAVQEERLSRRKNDAAFPARRHRMVPRVTPGSSRTISTRSSSTSAAC